MTKTSPTGRIVEDTPEIQNIPVRTEEGNRVRAAFLPHHPADSSASTSGGTRSSKLVIWPWPGYNPKT